MTNNKTLWMMLATGYIIVLILIGNFVANKKVKESVQDAITRTERAVSDRLLNSMFELHEDCMDKSASQRPFLRIGFIRKVPAIANPTPKSTPNEIFGSMDLSNYESIYFDCEAIKKAYSITTD